MGADCRIREPGVRGRKANDEGKSNPEIRNPKAKVGAPACIFGTTRHACYMKRLGLLHWFRAALLRSGLHLPGFAHRRHASQRRATAISAGDFVNERAEVLA